VLPDGHITAATARSGWSDGRIVFADPDVEPLAWLIVDRDQLLDEGVLSVAYLEQSSGGDPRPSGWPTSAPDRATGRH